MNPVFIFSPNNHNDFSICRIITFYAISLWRIFIYTVIIYFDLIPSFIALIQFSSYSHFFLVLALIGAVQIAVGNLIEPKIMGQTLNISPLVVIIALTFWGALWGVLGMILSVPITVMLIIVFAQFESTKNVAILLSARGKV